MVSFLSQVLAADQQAAQRPNVLFIAIDDLRPELGSFGVPYAQTPNLDRLAVQGVAFTNHFVQVPTCGASRYALLTGRSPAVSGVKRSNSAFYSGASKLSAEQLPGAQTFPELFRRSGYHTVLIGKISHTADGRVFAYNGKGDGREEVPHAWDELATPFGPWKRGWGTFFAYANGRHREDGKGHRDLMEFVVEKDEDLPDGLMAQTAIKKLQQLKANGKPFFMGLGFFKPHLPFVAPKQDWDALAAAKIPAPKYPNRVDSPYWHGSGEFYKYATPYEKKRPLMTKDALTARRAYLACARYSDRQVGKVLAELDRLKLTDNTIVVVWGDHGWFLGEVALWAKHTLFERAVRSPLIIRAPGLVTKPGRRCDSLVETLDIYPTLVEACNPTFRKTHHPLSGRSLLPLLKNESREIRKAAISYWGNTISVRTQTHRLIAKTGKDGPTNVELYELANGPDPVDNVTAKQPNVVKRLIGLLPTQP
jgi:arylsulfatase A-like enzyme